MKLIGFMYTLALTVAFALASMTGAAFADERSTSFDAALGQAVSFDGGDVRNVSTVGTVTTVTYYDQVSPLAPTKAWYQTCEKDGAGLVNVKLALGQTDVVLAQEQCAAYLDKAERGAGVWIN